MAFIITFKITCWMASLSIIIGFRPFSSLLINLIFLLCNDFWMKNRLSSMTSEIECTPNIIFFGEATACNFSTTLSSLSISLKTRFRTISSSTSPLIFFFTTWSAPLIPANGFRISWATPADNFPIATKRSTFSISRSIFFFSSISEKMATTPIRLPEWSLIISVFISMVSTDPALGEKSISGKNWEEDVLKLVSSFFLTSPSKPKASNHLFPRHSSLFSKLILSRTLFIKTTYPFTSVATTPMGIFSMIRSWKDFNRSNLILYCSNLFNLSLRCSLSLRKSKKVAAKAVIDNREDVSFGVNSFWLLP